MKYIVVTGSCGGIGKQTVIDLINVGYYVIGLDNNVSDLINDKYHHIKCDLTLDNEIKYAVNEINKITHDIYMIYNLAGIFMLEPLIEGKTSDLEKIININFFGVVRINKALFHYLNKDSRIVVFSSEVARYSPQPFNGYYSLSKIIVDKYADILRRELNYVDIKVIKVQSGAIKTNLLTGVNSKYEKTLASTKLYKNPLIKLKSLMDNEINKQVDPSIISKLLVKISFKRHPKMLYKIKNSFKLRFLNLLPERLQDYIYIRVIK